MTLVMNMMKTRDRCEDSDVRWMPTGDIDPSKGRCDGLDDQGCLAPRGRVPTRGTNDMWTGRDEMTGRLNNFEAGHGLNM